MARRLHTVYGMHFSTKQPIVRRQSMRWPAVLATSLVARAAIAQPFENYPNAMAGGGMVLAFLVGTALAAALLVFGYQAFQRRER